MNMLAIDTSNQVLGVALMRQNDIVAELTTNIKKDHSSRLMPAIVDIMEKVSMTPNQLDHIIVANGPGSYTGTRIGVTTAKTMAWTLDIPITPISSLQILAANGSYFNGYICPFIDARRKTVYTGLYQWSDGQLKKVKQETNIYMETWLSELDSVKDPILFISPDVQTFESMIKDKLSYAVIPTNQASHLLRPSNLFMLKDSVPAVPVHEAVPNYLRVTEAEANWMKQQKDGPNHG